MCIYDRYNFLIVEYVGHDWAIITRKPGSNLLTSKASDCYILGSGEYILGGGGIVWIVVGGGGFILVEMGGGMFIVVSGRCCWVVIGLFW